MLLRSSSTPIALSWIHPASSPEPDFAVRLSPAQTVSLFIPSTDKITRRSSESDLKRLSVTRKVNASSKKPLPVLVEKGDSLYRETASLLGPGSVRRGGGVVVEEKVVPGVALVGGGVGGGGGNGRGSDDWNWKSGDGSESMDEHYRKMIKAHPGDPLLLGNYARFLKEVRGDAVKAEEYCERAIVAEASDGNVLSMYGDLIWKNHKDGDRAKRYFDQAVQSSPDDCYVFASYAKFLWDADEDAEEEKGMEKPDANGPKKCKSSAPLTSLAAAY